MTAIVRPSLLARAWNVHPRTVVDWIHRGILVGSRGPGGQFHTTVDEVRAFCDRSEYLVPVELTREGLEIVLFGKKQSLPRPAYLLASQVRLLAFKTPYIALARCLDNPPKLVILHAPWAAVEDVFDGLRSSLRTMKVPVIAFDVRTQAERERLLRRGALHVLSKRDRTLLTDELRAFVTPGPQ